MKPSVCKGVNFLNGLAATEQKQEPCRVQVTGFARIFRDVDGVSDN